MGRGMGLGVCLWLGAGAGQRGRSRSGAGRGVRDEERGEKEYCVKLFSFKLLVALST
jgi:hypothetical protein